MALSCMTRLSLLSGCQGLCFPRSESPEPRPWHTAATPSLLFEQVNESCVEMNTRIKYLVSKLPAGKRFYDYNRAVTTRTMWSPDQQHQHYVEACYQREFSAPAETYQVRECGGPATCLSTAVWRTQFSLGFQSCSSRGPLAQAPI